jgi:hypothetical protein
MKLKLAFANSGDLLFDKRQEYLDQERNWVLFASPVRHCGMTFVIGGNQKESDFRTNEAL